MIFFFTLSSCSNIMQVPIFIAMSMYIIFRYLGSHKLCMASGKYNLRYISVYAYKFIVVLITLSWRTFLCVLWFFYA
jgi:hypothetical protein